EIGDTIAVGAALVKIEIAGDGPATTTPEAESPPPPARTEEAPAPQAKPAEKPAPAPAPAAPSSAAKAASAPARPPLHAGPGFTGAPRPEGERPLASPALRLRAMEAGVDLRQIAGTGPAGRITHDDFDAFIARGPQPVA